MADEAEQKQGMSEEELEDYIRSIAGSVPQPDEKHNVHTFLHNVAVAQDTTKIGNLKEEEVGMPKLPLRTYKELALFSTEVANMPYFGDYFIKKAEIMTATSLSKDAKLISLAVITRKEMADVTKRRTINKGWFKTKEVREGGD